MPRGLLPIRQVASDEPAHAIGFGRRVLLAEPLAARSDARRPVTKKVTQAVEKIDGGGRSLSRTRLHCQIPC
jgi:hypothetical protein